jgi:hypothetical protein
MHSPQALADIGALTARGNGCGRGFAALARAAPPPANSARRVMARPTAAEVRCNPRRGSPVVGARMAIKVRTSGARRKGPALSVR